MNTALYMHWSAMMVLDALKDHLPKGKIYLTVSLRKENFSPFLYNVLLVSQKYSN